MYHCMWQARQGSFVMSMDLGHFLTSNGPLAAELRQTRLKQARLYVRKCPAPRSVTTSESVQMKWLSVGLPPLCKQVHQGVRVHDNAKSRWRPLVLPMLTIGGMQQAECQVPTLPPPRKHRQRRRLKYILTSCYILTTCYAPA